MADNLTTEKFVDHVWDTSILPKLFEYIKIPNKSPAFDNNWEAHGHMLDAAQLLADWVASREIVGLSCEIITLPGRTPTLFCEIESRNGTSDPAQEDETVLLYGHYDKQPEFDGWFEGLAPWEPVLRDGKLYGRGGADDGYALFASLLAIEVLQRNNRPHPRCVLLIEGCEESGSFDLPYYVDHLKTRIGTPSLVVCLDAECGNYDQLWVTTSLRGMLPGTLSVQILDQGQHSGAAGGIVPSTFRILRQLIQRVEDATSGELHATLSVDIPKQIHTDAQHTAQVLGIEIVQRFPWHGNAHPDTDDLAGLLVANSWQPSLATVGIDGAPAVADAGNTLRPETSVKLVFRLPPTLDAAAAAQTIKQVLEADPPYGARVSFDLDTPQTGWCAPVEAAWLSEAIQSASIRHFQKPAMHMGMGGTIPFMKMLGDAYPQTQFLVTGVLGPLSNAHGPNEFLHLQTARRLTGVVADVIEHAASRTQLD